MWTGIIFNNIHISTFGSLHTWRSGMVSHGEFAQTIAKEMIPIARSQVSSFMPAVVNENIYTSLKVTNKADFTMADIIW